MPNAPHATSTINAPAIIGSYVTVWVGTGLIQPASPYLASINPNPVPVGAILGGGTVGTGYAETITASGGTAPYSYSVTSGSLPTGLSMTSLGAITGTPTVAGSYTFTITVTDNIAATGSQAFTIEVVAASSGGNSGFVS